MVVGDQIHAPAALSPGKGGGINYRGKRVSVGRAWRGETLLTTLGFGPRLVQPLASLYTAYDIPAI
jgi:hypothetical protein